ncbi:3-phosphoserine/phosphohydroxythreonine transaminase [Brackiella oedipodis]|uniref:3-phosphoserine/phosphohydroxythreonine transaminase n=1 Tax=Brackiella oedipodis TaxID=124225 RepID=UPI0005711640|nr:3-phosphoserine/phosphohydroxythreonine transaminase [Brackiella oedipodis]
MTQDIFWNFSAGPSVLPKAVLQQAAEEMINWHSSGQSVMEMSHRGAEFVQIYEQAAADLRTLIQAPEDYEVLFMQGGATAQNAVVPLNLIALKDAHKADYVVTGNWSKKSYHEAQRYGQIHLAASNMTEQVIDEHHYAPATWIPEFETWQLDPEASYLHFCSNETIGGLEIATLPDLDALGAPSTELVVDVSSHFLSRQFDVQKCGLLYAGAQKNAGPAGVTIVVVRKDLLGKAADICPSAFNYANVAQAHSSFNTPPTYAIYIAGLVYRWLLNEGGIAVIEQRNKRKAELLYQTIDASDFYHNPVQRRYRSRMNVPFTLADESLNEAFLKQAKQAGLLNLKGHKSVGGMRASIYNAMPLEGVQALVDFMQEFERRHG